MSKPKRWFLPYELDAFDNAGTIGVACGLDAAKVVYGNMLMWRHVWRTKSDLVTTAHVQAFFGANACEALTLFGHLEPSATSYRVKGAAEWLRVMSAQSEAGKAHTKNLIPGGPKGLGSPSAPTPKRPEAETKPIGSPSALPETSDQRPETSEKTHTSASALQAVWNLEKPPECPKWLGMPPGRLKAASTRMDEQPDLEVWRGAIRRLHQSAFCRGGGPRGWKADPEFLLRPDTLTRIVEGAFDGQTNSKGPIDAATQHHFQTGFITDDGVVPLEGP